MSNIVIINGKPVSTSSKEYADKYKNLANVSESGIIKQTIKYPRRDVTMPIKLEPLKPKKNYFDKENLPKMRGYEENIFPNIQVSNEAGEWNRSPEFSVWGENKHSNQLPDVDVWGSTNPYVERDSETGQLTPSKKESNTYWDPVRGAQQRWRSSMDNGTNPLVGLGRTVLPAAAIASGTLAPTNTTNLAGLSKLLGLGALQGTGYNMLSGNKQDAISAAVEGATGELLGPLVSNPAKIKKGVSDFVRDNSSETFYHGSPVSFDKFDGSFIGSGEGGSKNLKGINLWHGDGYKSAPKFANIRSEDAPLHLGVPSKPLSQPLNPTVYTVKGKGLNLFETPHSKGLTEKQLMAQGYHGIRTPLQVTVFPEFVDKLKIKSKQSIPDFINSHPEIQKWTKWTTKETW